MWFDASEGKWDISWRNDGVRISHFQTLQPLCPRCLATGKEKSLSLQHVSQRIDDMIISASLVCKNKACATHYPIIDGVPVLVHPLQQYINDNFYVITQRQDLSLTTEALLGDAAGPKSVFNSIRHYLSTYVYEHYADCIEGISIQPTLPGQSQGGSIRSCLSRGLNLMLDSQRTLRSPVLDIGCAVGRTSLELSKTATGISLGIDLNFSLLRFAQSMLRESTLQFPLKKLGIVYDRATLTSPLYNASLVDFWACDALAPPFSPATFGFIGALNVLDTVSSPKALLHAVGTYLRADGNALFTTPYDWSTPAPVQHWLGGHAQYADDGGESATILRQLLDGSTAVGGLRVIAEIEHHPWPIRRNARRSDIYDIHILLCDKCQN